MKIYSLPDSLPAPVVDYRNYDREAVQAAEDAHIAALKAYLIDMGYTGKHTGDIYSAPIADGFALYMVADAARGAGLIHLPYGDGYQCPNVQHLPKRAIFDRIKSDKNMVSIFAKKSA